MASITQFTPKESAAGERIVRWARKCSEARTLERDWRSRISPGDSPFYVERVVTRKRRRQFCEEVRGVLRFYATPAGQKFRQQTPFAEKNWERWIDIDSLIQYQRYLPVAVRNSDGVMQGVSLVTTDHKLSRVEILELATAPHNLGKRSGAGTAAYTDAVWLCIRRGYDQVRAVTISEAAPFYKKMGVHFEGRVATLPREEFPQFMKERGCNIIN